MSKVLFSPSLMTMDLDKFKEQIEFLNQHVDSYHIDIMDGHYVPNLTLSPWFIEEVRKISHLPMSAHLMVTDQSFWVNQLISQKCEWICMHVECLDGLAFRLIDQIHAAGLKAGVVLNPETPIETIFPYIDLVDKITIMTVDPGFAGQRFIESTLDKIVDLRKLRQEKGYHYLIEMDGSSNRKSFKRIDHAGPDIYIIGRSGLFGLDEDIEKSWAIMKRDYEETTGKKEEFIPIQKGHVGMYVCGPTVYNYIHIGNARSTIAFDTIRRYFEYRGYKVDFVSNFTDVDDKIIRTANELGITAPEVADRFIRAFEEDTKALNVEPATLHPRVMDHMPDILAFIQVLVEKGYAYESSGDVYYRTRKFENYGKLSDQSIDELEVGASQRTGEEQQQKEDPLDFALWKQAKPGEISWDSPWGKGRPGWHIECSVMATKHLGETIDIHGGGQDLEFPHHENEIAQSEAKTGKKFANYWMHNGYVTIGEDDEKMSKSLGNFITVHEMIQNVDPQVLRFFMATTQYRRPIRYSETTMKEAATNLQRLKNTFDNLKFRQETASENLADDADKITLLENLEQRFIEEMDDDFNAANGITVVYELAKWLNTYLDQAEVSAAVLAQGEALFSQWLSIFGILFTAEELLDEEIEQLIEERNQARSNRDFARSDEIRDLLKEKGILLEDTPQGTRWRREA